MLKDNLGLRLFALLLAIFLWLQSALISEQRSVVSLPINLLSVPQNITLENFPSSIPFAVRGKGLDIIRLMMAKPRVNIDASKITPNTDVISLQDYSIDLPDNINVSLLGPAESDQLTIQADIFHQKVVPVQLDFENAYTENRFKELRYNIDPDRVTIFGQKKRIRNVNAILTKKVDQETLTNDSAELKLNIPADITSSETKVLLTISGADQATRVFPNIALPAGYLPARVAVRLQAPAAALDAVKPNQITARVSDKADENGLYTVELTLPEGTQAIAITPSKVRARK
ncbi:MAG: hypothetical protein LHW64_00860 [Candidatus Cloacimonetes bacterium]|jgi:YbbR domain-containing protein|nr:hypothetical protein [Candidatus Cloacimonadota bacterium]MCB5286338.1 hypothetical protein [Candidatus Cloacimonadota bacterium]MCK9184061.1 hypothetical protein [Candidatus Cloacimonadota bacterium]MCK9583737.1 hypothetical protein [Candidatus Cloacimonadota bacterium]MDY0228660.1 hypothetical protein [Candidatus Cloacimonadaceae bacterium]